MKRLYLLLIVSCAVSISFAQELFGAYYMSVYTDSSGVETLNANRILLPNEMLSMDQRQAGWYTIVYCGEVLEQLDLRLGKDMPADQAYAIKDQHEAINNKLFQYVKSVALGGQLMTVLEGDSTWLNTTMVLMYNSAGAESMPYYGDKQLWKCGNY